MSALADFSYLSAVAGAYGFAYTQSDFDDFLEHSTDQQIDELAAAYRLLRNDKDTARLFDRVEFCLLNESKVDPAELSYAQKLSRVFVLFDFLGDKGISPFAEMNFRPKKDPRIPNWGNLPSDFSYLKGPAEAFGGLLARGEMAILAFLSTVNTKDKAQLRRVAARIRRNSDAPKVFEWLKSHSFVDHEEAARVYGLFGVLDLGGFRFD